MKDFYVYMHRRNDTNEIFYVGKGVGDRARTYEGRNKDWLKIVYEHGRSIEIAASQLEHYQAVILEMTIISMMVKEGVRLVNKNNILIQEPKWHHGNECYGQMCYPWRHVVSTTRVCASVKDLAREQWISEESLNEVLRGETAITASGWCINEPKRIQR